MDSDLKFCALCKLMVANTPQGKTPHSITTANGKAILRHQRRTIPLRPPAHPASASGKESVIVNFVMINGEKSSQPCYL